MVKPTAFISYNHKDSRKSLKEFCEKYIPTINDYINVWYDDHIDPGEDIMKKALAKMSRYKIIILFITKNYLKSKNCIREFNKAETLYNKKKATIIPIVLENFDTWQKLWVGRLKAITIANSKNKNDLFL